MGETAMGNHLTYPAPAPAPAPAPDLSWSDHPLVLGLLNVHLGLVHRLLVAVHSVHRAVQEFPGQGKDQRFVTGHNMRSKAEALFDQRLINRP